MPHTSRLSGDHIRAARARLHQGLVLSPVAGELDQRIIAPSSRGASWRRSGDPHDMVMSIVTRVTGAPSRAG